jgi:hypothetical protein
MVRRSAKQQNLSRYMMAEIITQENHCFSISSQTKYTHQPSTNTDNIILPEMSNAVICPETGKSLKHQELITNLGYKIKWMRSTANQINRLFNTNTIRFIRKSDIPNGRKVTYGSFVVDIKDHKDEKERTRLTVGGDQIEYPGDKSTRTAGLTTAKILINSVISTPSAKFLVIDMNFFNLNMLIPQVRQARKYPNSPWETIHPLGEIMQYVREPTRATRMGAPSHSQPLINTKYQIQVTNYLQTII